MIRLCVSRRSRLVTTCLRDPQATSRRSSLSHHPAFSPALAVTHQLWHKVEYVPSTYEIPRTMHDFSLTSSSGQKTSARAWALLCLRRSCSLPRRVYVCSLLLRAVAFAFCDPVAYSRGVEVLPHAAGRTRGTAEQSICRLSLYLHLVSLAPRSSRRDYLLPQIAERSEGRMPIAARGI